MKPRVVSADVEALHRRFYGGRRNAEREYRSAFGEYVQHGLVNMSDEARRTLFEKRDLSAGTGSAGGFAVPQDFLPTLVQTLKYASSIYDLARVITTENGRPMPFPQVNDTATAGATVNENTSVGASVDIVLGQHVLNAWTYQSQPLRASLVLEQDSTAIDLAQAAAEIGTQRIARIVDQHLCTGDGSAKPFGAFRTGGFTATVTGAAQTTVSYAELVALEASLDVAYRRNAAWVMAPTTWQAIRNLQDTQGRPLVLLDQDLPPVLFGHPVQLSNNAPALGASNLTIALGDWNRGYFVRQMLPEQIAIRERYADLRQVEFVTIWRLDGGIADSKAVVLFQNHA